MKNITKNALTLNGTVLLILTVIGSIVTTRAYGGNFVAQTVPEAITDLLIGVVFLNGYVMVTVGRMIK